MPLALAREKTTLIVRRDAFERVGLLRSELDQRLGLTDEEFRVEGGLVCIGPIHEETALTEVIAELEERGLVYFDDFFDVSGNWPEWLTLFAMATRGDPRRADG
ncbi:MAG TPA: hypothetical protein VLE53_11440 [Gemmatimonadaceae bacterium]|nr:hypothetical protein [Gemmatimonadaceae bacterium]